MSQKEYKNNFFYFFIKFKNFFLSYTKVLKLVNHALSLQKLLNNYINNDLIKNILINKIILDSRKIKGKNCLFIAVKGHKKDGKNFIEHAITKGAAAILTYPDNIVSYRKIFFKKNIPIIYLPNLHKYISYFAGILYGNPSEKIPVIGITGTNGKTSVTNFLMQWLYFLKKKPAILSTIGNGFYKKLIKTNNTTDSAVKIQSSLKNFIDKKADIVIMEVSAHGITQFRVANIIFYIGIFTNLSRDHLDYYYNMKNYELSKWNFFSKYKIKKKIINIDDNIGYKWFKKLPNTIAITTKKRVINKSNLFFNAKKIIFFEKKTIILFKSSWGNGKIKINLIGHFNVLNIILTITALLSLNYPLKELLKTASKIYPVEGRMQEVCFKKKSIPKIIIDYAHTPDSLKNVLLTIKLFCKRKIWCVFGCGGERDIGKRSMMGNIATKFANYVILTNDNPRTENALNIINDIKKGCKTLKNVYSILDRTKAISYAIFNSHKKDTILITGKGHENYQIIGNKTLNYSDYNTIQKILKKY
ncbi:UDP-N-acetylmuramoyl-L-alanyl-D-glutamate--2,6-diaminopimelate ligase [Enterobacteriaceae endosymbiont of Donacia clavipes]|uniref:UDP-N-acetylmuramoyl-L-alanyl-D-glutamate--2, 6-diaminopimelate ligase n=1 Tax=Enterobacteriaceae endosymbiont of Donacia clavipes TaxID=2675775 RepID=UPI001456CFC8|nr:UDP-N-acetylmuramoyl-L-alanyl-D-glutamate--2,6-diaminopimelate ligase [Enterobacteriaceae endosymbiont of Donacia clavipes]